MRENTSCWLRALTAALFLLLLAGAAGAALTIVRLREEVSHLAAATTQLQATAGETTRLLQEMGAAVAAAQQPEVLRAVRRQPARSDERKANCLGPRHGHHRPPRGGHATARADAFLSPHSHT